VNDAWLVQQGPSPPRLHVCCFHLASTNGGCVLSSSRLLQTDRDSTRGSTILYAWRRLQASCVRVFAAPADTRVMVLKLKHTLAAPSSAPRHRVMRRTAPPRALLAGTDRSIDSKIVASGLWGTHSIAASCRACGSCSA
jgi:hypothetical protein